MRHHEAKDDCALTNPILEVHDGIDVLRFSSAWQIKLLCNGPFLDFMSGYIESREPPYKIILCLDSVSGLTLVDLGNLVAVFYPLVEEQGTICLCNLQSDVLDLVRLHLKDCLFLITSNLEEAIAVVRTETPLK